MAGDAPSGVDGAHTDAPVVGDGPPAGDYTCLGTSAPTTADPQITIAGLAAVLEMGAPKAGTITVQARRQSDDAMLGSPSTTTTTSNQYSLGPLTTNGAPLALYVELDGSGTTQGGPTYYYPVAPLTTSLSDYRLLLEGQGDLEWAATNLFQMTQDPSLGALEVYEVDCANHNLTFVVGDLHASQNGSELTLTEVAPGAALNVPPGRTTVWIVHGGVTFPSQIVKIGANAATNVTFAPGPI